MKKLKNTIIIYIISSIIFIITLYSKQSFPNYINHSLVILLLIIGIEIPIINKKYKITKVFLILVSICLFISSSMILSYNKTTISTNEYRGIDVSKWNKEIDFQAVKQEVDFVIIRCGYTSLTDGTKTKEDKYFKYNIEQCIALNIPYGIYYYSLARDEAQAKKEADFVNSLLTNQPPLGVFIDLEDEDYQKDLSSSQLCSLAVCFLNNIPYPSGIYASLSWWQDKLTDPSLDNYIKWVAHYNDKADITGYNILQYSKTGNINGINGDVDLNLITNKYW